VFALTENQSEANRLLTVCNACRYCESYCPVFPAMMERRSFVAADLDHLANLCHNCTACYHACQYKPPHPLEVNLPQTLAAVRNESYARHAWPDKLAGAFHNNGLVVSLLAVCVLSATLLLAFTLVGSPTLTSAHLGPGAFYAVIPHALIVGVAGGTFLFSILAMGMSGARFWRSIGGESRIFFCRDAHFKALAAAATLRHLDGGHGDGCNTVDDAYSNARRYFHQVTMWGFLLCFAATCTATVYEVFLEIPSPFPLTSLPVLLGIVGGIGLIVGPLGLVYNKITMHPATQSMTRSMDYTFLVLLLAISLSGFALMLMRETGGMGVLLAVHLAIVLTFFIAMPYSKFVHGVYRYLALLKNTFP
jgi:citrate/tricarballylate utilization protein